jgi:hypothetical protein
MKFGLHTGVGNLLYGREIISFSARQQKGMQTSTYEWRKRTAVLQSTGRDFNQQHRCTWVPGGGASPPDWQRRACIQTCAKCSEDSSRRYACVVQNKSVRIKWRVGSITGSTGCVTQRRKQSGVPFNLQMNEPHILITLLQMYIPRNGEFGSALVKLRNFGGGGWTPNPPPPVRHGRYLECK